MKKITFLILALFVLGGCTPNISEIKQIENVSSTLETPDTTTTKQEDNTLLPSEIVEEVINIKQNTTITPTVEIQEVTTTKQEEDVSAKIEIPANTTTIKEIIAEPALIVVEQKNDNEEKTFLVTRVIDGDTIEIEGGQKVRYIGIDTPETVDPRKPVQCFGKEASAKNKELVGGKKVRLEKDVSETDRYGRMLCYVYVGDIFVNLELVKQGYASSYSYPPDIKHQELFVNAQKQARENNLGLWSACQNAEDIKTIVPPVIVTSSTNNNSPTDCKIKGNISSKDEKIYHLIGCGSYNLTKIDEARGEKWFCTEAEAVTAGWRKAENCP